MYLTAYSILNIKKPKNLPHKKRSLPDIKKITNEEIGTIIEFK